MKDKDIINSISIIEKELEKLKNNFKNNEVKVQSQPKPPSQKSGVNDSIIKLIRGHGWKEAIDSEFICFDEESKFDRAENIVETLIIDDLEFLDHPLHPAFFVEIQ